MSTDQLTFDDPTKRHAHIKPKSQSQELPGLDRDLEPTPDKGEETYRGTGRLKGRKALVTGGDSGIGAAVAIAFAREGADVVITYLPSEQPDAEHVGSVMEKEGVTVGLVPGDLRERDFCSDLVTQTVDTLGGLDILVNNAGHQVFQEDFEDFDEEQLDRTFKTNLYAMFWLTKDAMPHMPPGSTIINTTSVQAYKPSPVLVDYATTKDGINGFTKGLAMQVASKGIRVNAVAPGPVWSVLQVTEGQPEEKLEGFGENTALGRMGQPVEMAPAYVFLASPESSYVVGETINANGGLPVP